MAIVIRVSASSRKETSFLSKQVWSSHLDYATQDTMNTTFHAKLTGVQSVVFQMNPIHASILTIQEHIVSFQIFSF